MKMFYKRNTSQSLRVDGIQRIKDFIEIHHRKYADILNLKVAKMKKSTLIICFWIFCLSFTAVNIFCLVNSLKNKTAAFWPDKISIPSHIFSGDTLATRPLFGDKELTSIISFQLFLDSLKSTLSGSKMYDSLIRNRHGLFDSIAVIENIYKEQFKLDYHGKEPFKH